MARVKTHLIVGYGEVGRALHKIIKGSMTSDHHKGGTWNGYEIDIVHICIPYKNEEEFVRTIKFYKDYSDLIIVHSSVPVGTCDGLGIVHSPIRGVHPYLEEGIRTFVKYFGGKDADKAAKIFKDLKIRTKVFKDAKTTEAIKLWDTTQYGKLIMMEKQIYKWCQDNGVNFKDVYTDANMEYNLGYLLLGRPEVVRPYLKHMEGPIGGHCVKENAKLLKVKL